MIEKIRNILLWIFVITGFVSFIMLIGSAGAMEVETADVSECSKQMWTWLGIFAGSIVLAKIVGNDIDD